jgi:DSF synthase
MNAAVPARLLSIGDDAEIIRYADGSADFAVSEQLACHYEASEAAVWSQWTPQGIPAFNPELLHDLERASQMIEGFFAGSTEQRMRYIVLRSGVPGVFNLGGDLGYFQRLIGSGDRARLTEYARAAVNVIYRNYVGHDVSGATTIALLEGDALGGGFECALSCDVVIAERHVKAGFPEVLFGMFPGMGGLSFLHRRVGKRIADDMVRTGRQYSALELKELGVIDEVVEMGEGPSAVRRMMRNRDLHQAAHVAMNRADRIIAPVNLQELNDVVKLWVDCAMQMSTRNLEWMQRLFQRQLGIFGRPLERQRAELVAQAAKAA